MPDEEESDEAEYLVQLCSMLAEQHIQVAPRVKVRAKLRRRRRFDRA
jgi:hypothetical protein